MILRSFLVVPISFFLLLSFSHNADGISVMSVDLGSEWMKIGIVSPGVPMEIVLNKESKRKTPVAVSFREGERLIGEDALTVAVRFPPNAYRYFMDLLGKKIDNPMVELFQKRFPYYNLVAHSDRGTVLFQHDNETHYSPEELLGMVLNQAREYAQDFAKQPVKEAVITVPPYFNQAERRAVMNAAELAGIKVLQLMNSNTASALNYGIFRRNDFNETAQRLLLYDMGASSTVATIISYQIVKTKEKGIVESNPQLQVLGVGYDRTLGGLEMQLRLRDFLGTAFNDMKKTKSDVFSNHRSLAKLFKEAGRLKNVLSANTEHAAQVEGLLDEKDFKHPVGRQHFENLCHDLFDRVNVPVEQALKAAGLTMDLIDQVILVGAGTRVPKVQEKLAEVMKRDLGKSLNTDEAAAMGAVYKGADLSSGFKVKKFITKDAVLFPILVDFERELETDEASSKTVKVVRRTLFSHMNPYPQKKILTFNKHVNDFTFYVSYGELPVPSHEALAIGSQNITKIDLKGVGTAIEKNKGEGVEPKGVKAHFFLDENGLFSLNLVESVFEKNTTVEPVAEDTLSKLGSAFTNLFSGGSHEPTPEESTHDSEDGKAPDDHKPHEGETGDSHEKDTGNESVPNVGEGSTKSANESGESDAGNTGKIDDAKIPDKVNATAEANKPKLVIVKESIEVQTYILDVLPLDGEQFKVSSTKLKELDEIDRTRTLREKARNALESFVSDMQHKAYSDDHELFLTEEEREAIGKFCSETSDWLYEDGADAEKNIYEDKLKEIKLLTKDFLDRAREYRERPDALEALDKMLNISTSFLDGSKKLPEDLQYFSEIELTTLDKAVKETLEWKEKQLEEQAKTPLSEAPVLTIRSIAEKIDTLDREVKYMMNKARVEKLKKQREDAAKLVKEAEEKLKADKLKAEQTPSSSVHEELPITEIPPADWKKFEEMISENYDNETFPEDSEVPVASEENEPSESTGEPLHTEL